MTAPKLGSVEFTPQGYRAPYLAQPSQELLEELRGSPQRIKDAMRLRAQRDRYFLAKGVLGYKDVNEYTHGPLCRALADKSRQRRMYLMPRGHLKTTLATITDSICDALDDPMNFTCLLVNEIIENSVNFLKEIKAHFQGNPIIHELFPELIPEKFGGPGSNWGTTHATLRRDGSFEREATWTATGVGSAIVSHHFKRIKNDDLIGFDARQSPAAMAYAISYTKAQEPLLTDMEQDIIDWIGTRWAIYDLYREILNLYGDDLAYFAREDIEIVPKSASDDLLRSARFRAENLDEVRGTAQPIFPAKFSLKRLQRFSVIDPVTYYAQYKNNPIAAGLTDFNYEQVQPFQFDRWGNVVYRDRISGILLRWRLDELDIVMVADPNSGSATSPDLAAVGVYGMSSKDQMFALEVSSRRDDPDEFVERIYDTWAIWQPRGCRVYGIEKAGQQTTGFYFRKLARDRNLTINVEDMKPRNREKPTRIRKSLQPIINLGNFYALKTQLVTRHQIQFHPGVQNDDELDTAAYATELFVKPSTKQEQDEVEEMEEKILASRSSLTGYSA